MKAKSKTKRSQKGPEEVTKKFPEEIDETTASQTMDIAHLNPGYIFEYSSIDQMIKYYINGSESISVSKAFSQINKIFDEMIEGAAKIKQLISKECSMMFECKICKNIYRQLNEFILHKEKFCLQVHSNICNHYEFRTEMENDNILNSSNTTIPSSNLKPISKNLSHIVEMLAQKKSQETNQSIKKLPEDQQSNENNPSSSNLLESSLEKRCSTVENSISDISEDERNGIKIGLSSKYIQHYKNLKSLNNPYFKENPKKIQIQVRKDYLKNQNPPENVFKNEDTSKDQETTIISEHLGKNVDFISVKLENDSEQPNLIKQSPTLFDNKTLSSTSNVIQPPFKSDISPCLSLKVSSNLQCLTCKRKCKNSSALEKHLSSHRGGPRYRCIDCSYKAYTRRDCLKHAREIHIKSDKKQRASDFIQLIEPGREDDFLTTDINQNDSQRNIAEYSPKTRLSSTPTIKIEPTENLDFEQDMTNLKKKFTKRLVIDSDTSCLIQNNREQLIENTEIKCESTNTKNDDQEFSFFNEPSSSNKIKPSLVNCSKNIKNKDNRSSRTNSKKKNNHAKLKTQVNKRFLKKSKAKPAFKSSLRSKISLRKSLLKNKLLNTNKSYNDFSFIERVSRLSTLRSNVKKSEEASLAVDDLKKSTIKNRARKLKLKSTYFDSTKNKHISPKDKIKIKLPLKSKSKSPVKLKNLQKVQESSPHEFKFTSPNCEENFNFTPSDEDFDIYAEELISHISMFQSMPEFKSLPIKNEKVDTFEKGSSKNNKCKENKLLQKKGPNKNISIKKKKSSNLNKTIGIRKDSKKKISIRKNSVEIKQEIKDENIDSSQAKKKTVHIQHNADETKQEIKDENTDSSQAKKKTVHIQHNADETKQEIKDENTDSSQVKKKAVHSSKNVGKMKATLEIAQTKLLPSLNASENPSYILLLPSTSNCNSLLKPNSKSDINDSIVKNAKTPVDIPIISPNNITKTKTPVDISTTSIYFTKTKTPKTPSINITNPKTPVGISTTSLYFTPITPVNITNAKTPIQPSTSQNNITKTKTRTTPFIITNANTAVDIPPTSPNNITKIKTRTTPVNIAITKTPVDIPTTSPNIITMTKTPVKITPSIIITNSKTPVDIPTTSTNIISKSKTPVKKTPSIILTPVDIPTISSNNITKTKSLANITTPSIKITNAKTLVDIPTTSSNSNQGLEKPSTHTLKHRDLSINSSKLVVPSDSSFSIPRLIIVKNNCSTTLKQSKLTTLNNSTQKLNGCENEKKKQDSVKSPNTLYYRLEMKNKDLGNCSNSKLYKPKIKKEVSENSSADISLCSPIKKEVSENSSADISLCSPEIKKEVSENSSADISLCSPEIKKEVSENSSADISLCSPEIKKEVSENSSADISLGSPEIKKEVPENSCADISLSIPEIKKEDSINEDFGNTSIKEEENSSITDISLYRPVRKRVKIHLPDFYYESDMPKAKRSNISSKPNKFRMKKL